MSNRSVTAVTEEIIRFHGQANITATHATTLEVTREEHTTKRGNCIVGVGADKACVDLSQQTKTLLRQMDTIVRVLIEVGGWSFEATASGDPSLVLSSSVEMVLRKSSFICPRTLAVRSNRSAFDLPRQMVLLLQNEDQEGFLTLQLFGGSS